MRHYKKKRVIAHVTKVVLLDFEQLTGTMIRHIVVMHSCSQLKREIHKQSIQDLLCRDLLTVRVYCIKCVSTDHE